MSAAVEGTAISLVVVKTIGGSGSKLVTVVGIEAEMPAEGWTAVDESPETSATAPELRESQADGAAIKSLGLLPPRQMSSSKPGVNFFYKRSDRKKNGRRVTKFA